MHASQRSRGSTPRWTADAIALQRKLPWVSSAPLGAPDVPDVKRMARGESAGAGAKPGATGIGPDGREVLSAYFRVPKVGWTVFVELPAAEALGPVWSALYKTLALLALGVVLAGAAGTLLARRMVVPITELQAGARIFGEGDLTQRIPVRTGGACIYRFEKA